MRHADADVYSYSSRVAVAVAAAGLFKGTTTRTTPTARFRRFRRTFSISLLTCHVSDSRTRHHHAIRGPWPARHHTPHSTHRHHHRHTTHHRAHTAHRVRRQPAASGAADAAWGLGSWRSGSGAARRARRLRTAQSATARAAPASTTAGRIQANARSLEQPPATGRDALAVVSEQRPEVTFGVIVATEGCVAVAHAPVADELEAVALVDPRN
eukprot:scaffold15589_cov111-Isochrysis_galbana.AAC.4